VFRTSYIVLVVQAVRVFEDAIKEVMRVPLEAVRIEVAMCAYCGCESIEEAARVMQRP
jgi:hypothetical protein